MNCLICNKKLKLTAFPCKCKNMYCKTHSQPENHSCVFDYKSENKKNIETKNPVILPSKLVS